MKWIMRMCVLGLLVFLFTSCQNPEERALRAVEKADARVEKKLERIDQKMGSIDR